MGELNVRQKIKTQKNHMKESYLAVIAALVAFIAYNGLALSQREGVIGYILLGMIIFFFSRAIYTVLPVPLTYDNEQQFFKDHPEALDMSREDKLIVYRSWKRSKNKSA